MIFLQYVDGLLEIILLSLSCQMTEMSGDHFFSFGEQALHHFTFVISFGFSLFFAYFIIGVSRHPLPGTACARSV